MKTRLPKFAAFFSQRISVIRLRVPLVGGLCPVIIISAAVITVVACGWSFVTDHSVRFNSYRVGTQFYRLPPLPIVVDHKTGKELTVRETDPEILYAQDYQSDPDVDPAKIAWEKAVAAVDNGQLMEARLSLRKYLEITAAPSPDDDESVQIHRNDAYDMLDAITALDEGSPASAVKEYLTARSNSNVSPQRSQRSDQGLSDNWAYLEAAKLYSSGDKGAALKAFYDHARLYPRSEKNQAVLYMKAKILLESSCGYDDTAPQKYRYGSEKPAAPLAQCPDENWSRSFRAFQQLIQKYPAGRYVNDSRSWIAYLYEKSGDRARALIGYYRLLGNPNDRTVRLKAKWSLQYLGHKNEDRDLDKLESAIAGDVNTSMAYAYHRIYNYAVDENDAIVEFWHSREDDDEYRKEKQRVAAAHELGDHELSRIARFATAMMKRYSSANVSGGFVLRVAQAQTELKNFAEARNLAANAIALGVSGDLLAQALWIRGSAEHQLRSFTTARSTFKQLIAEFPTSKLTEGARRLLAVVAEDQGDLDTALEQYLKLGYDTDVAYFVDVLLTTDQLVKFVDQHTDVPRYNELVYAVAVRYMRDRRWSDARAALGRVRTSAKRPQTENTYTPQEAFPKEPDWDENESHFVRTEWVIRDLKTIGALESLENAVSVASGDEEKAEALYQLASYQFDANALLFYNPSAWQGLRMELLSQLDDGTHTRLPGESLKIFEHSESHEPLARSIAIYEEIIDKYPNTMAVKDAMFSVAVAHERLSNLNPYWRDKYENGLFAGTRLDTFADIVKRFPRFRWPISRNSWQASTRTVNGGSAYPPPPKLVPKLSPVQRVQRKIGRIWDMAGSKLKEASEAAGRMLQKQTFTILFGIGLLIFWRYRRDRS